MKGKIVVILVCILMLSTVAGSLPSTDTSINQTENETESSDRDYTHDIFGEFFTLTTCVPCKYSHRALKYLYAGEYHPLHYITLVYDNEVGNKWADQRHDELGVTASPTTVWDGGFTKDIGSNENIEEDMEEFNLSIIACGNRNVKDIELNLDVEWLGAVNENPDDGSTLIPIEQHMTWTSSEMGIDIEVVNNETSEYNGHLHVYVNEVNSILWDDKWGDPYTNCFLDYAWNEDVTISASSSWDDTEIWDGYDHHNGYNEYYKNITQDNIIVIASIFDEDNNDYADETTEMRTGYNTDPKRYDIYFGNTTPPPLLWENATAKKYIPGDILEWDKTYYWKVDERDQNGEMIYGDIWTFTTRGNDPPDDPGWEFPINQSVGIPIEVNLTWVCDDPDGDDLTFDVWFGDADLGIHQVVWNQTENWYVIKDLDFTKKYFWKIDAWEVDYDLFTQGPLWNFVTEINLPPDQAEDPKPDDGDPAVPQEGVILEWNGSDPNFGDTLRYDVYFDDVNPPLTKRVTEGYDDWWEVPFTLSKYNTYYWRIDTYDKSDEFTEGEVWQFTCGDNIPPTDPDINGPTEGGIDKTYDFTLYSEDPDGHDIKYTVRWGDGSEDETDYVPNATEVTLSHSWGDDRTYTIQAKATDVHGAFSDWSTHTIVIPRNKVFNFKLLELFFSRFPYAFPILRQLIGL